jgi:hypothetical protein
MPHLLRHWFQITYPFFALVLVCEIPGDANTRGVCHPDGPAILSRAGRAASCWSRAVVAIAGVLPYTALGGLLRFILLPPSLLATILVLALTYLFLVHAAKTWFYRRHALL